jgi:multiple sugar transport system permease protein
VRGTARARRRLHPETVTFYLFAAPWIVGFLVFTVGPMVASLYLSLTEYNMMTPPRWVGTLNYYRMLYGDKFYWQSLGVTLTYAVFHIPLNLAIALGAALLINQQLRGIYVFRTIFFLPSILPAIASSILWWYVFSKDYGLLNTILALVGISGPAWLETSTTALWAVIVIGLWGFGNTMVIFLAGLQSVPRELYEAAEIDGAGRWAKFRNVTLPMLSPVMFFNLTIGTIATFQVFTPAYVLGTVVSGVGTSGPANAYLFYALYLYNTAFRYFAMGYASALAWSLFLIIVAVTVVHFLLARRWVYYAGGR